MSCAKKGSKFSSDELQCLLRCPQKKANDRQRLKICGNRRFPFRKNQLFLSSGYVGEMNRQLRRAGVNSATVFSNDSFLLSTTTFVLRVKEADALLIYYSHHQEQYCSRFLLNIHIYEVTWKY